MKNEKKKRKSFDVLKGSSEEVNILHAVENGAKTKRVILKLLQSPKFQSHC